MTSGTSTASERAAMIEKRGFQLTRQFVLGAIFILIGIAVFIAGLGIDSGQTSTLFFAAPASGQSVSDVLHVRLPSMGFVLFTAGFFVLSGGAAAGLSQNEERARYGNYLLYVAGALIIPLILVVATVGGATNATVLFSESIRLATPIAIGSLAGLWCERTGVVNIAIEGMMLFGACFGFATFYFLRQSFGASNFYLLIGVLVAVGAGGLAALLHAWLSITFKTNQIVSGTVINILAVGVTSFIRSQFLSSTEAGFEQLPVIRIPLLADIPIIGAVFFNQKPIFYMMFVLLVLTHVVMYYTAWGLRSRSVGENPHAADTLGIRVNYTRWVNVFIGGLIAGLAGAWFSLETTGSFNDQMTSGRGFIALAALIFGKWTPAGAFGGALLFGFSDALGTRLQLLDVDVPSQFLQMVPYVVTIIVLAGLIGRSIAPKAVGEPYEKE